MTSNRSGVLAVPEYGYLALDRRGREVRGRMEAAAQVEVQDWLRRQSLYPVEISQSSALKHPRLGAGRWKRSDLVLVTMQLSHLLEAGMPVDRALEVLSTQVHKAVVRDRLAELLNAVRTGSSFSGALEQHPAIFPGLYIQMVRAGEASGRLEDVLRSLSGHLESEALRRSQVRGMLIYPAFVMGVAVLTTILTVTFVVPQVQQIFREFDEALPPATQFLMATSAWLSRSWTIVGAVFLLVSICLWRAMHTPRWRLAWDRYKLRLPVMGGVWQRLASARFARTLGVLLEGGVPVLEALAIAEGASGNVWMAQSIRQGTSQVREGVRLADALAGGPVPAMALEMIGLGEETGRLESVLVKVAQTFDFEADVALKRLAALAEPLIITFIGALLAFIIIAVILPIFSLSAGV